MFRVTSLNPLIKHSVLVVDLIDVEGKWKKEIVRYLFKSRDADIIMRILLVPSLSADVLVWHYVTYGRFTVKSAYYLGMEYVALKKRDHASSSSSSGPDRA